METSLRQFPTSQQSVSAIIVQQGRLLDFIDGITQRKETPEEYVRQEILKSLVREYGYPKSDFSVEYTLALGTRRPRADVVIFFEGADHDQGNAFILVECKSPQPKLQTKKQGVEQLKSYMAACENAVFGIWTNGIERFCFRRTFVAGRIVCEEIADIPEFGRADGEIDRPLLSQLKPATSDALLFAFRRCHNYIAANQGLQKPQAFWELLKLIFCKIHDEKNSENLEFFAAPAERTGRHGPGVVVKRISELFEDVKADFPRIFDKSEPILLDPKVLAYIVGQLQMYSLLESDTDVKGRAYEEIVGSNLRGDRGEFFTPRNICRMAVEMLDPSEKQLILDPACGTSGFLITAMNHVIEKIRQSELKRWNGNIEKADMTLRDKIHKFAEKFIVGIDFNPELVKASKMNMVMNNDGAGGLYQANSLVSPADWNPELRDRRLFGRVDLLFTNPPFGSKLPIDDPAVLRQFDLGHRWTYSADIDRWVKSDEVQGSQPPEILFVERCVQFLKQGTGRAAIVLPDGILGSPGLGYVRQWILEKCRILASLDLHPDTFQPFVSIQTSLLVLERKTDEQVNLEKAAGRFRDYEIFMAVVNHIGHDKRGALTYLRDEEGNEIVQELSKQTKDYEDGVKVIRNQIVHQKVVDDNTLQVAGVFKEWFQNQQ